MQKKDIGKFLISLQPRLFGWLSKHYQIKRDDYYDIWGSGVLIALKSGSIDQDELEKILFGEAIRLTYEMLSSPNPRPSRKHISVLNFDSRLLNRLTEKQRSIYVLRKTRKMRIRDVAESSHHDMGYVASVMSQIRKKYAVCVRRAQNWDKDHIELLPYNYREICDLSYNQWYRNCDIATRCGISQVHVAVILNKSREILKNKHNILISY